jgi:hypothetical protein
MPSTFGSFIVYQDGHGFHIAQSVPRHIDESNPPRTQYAGPRVLMPEVVPDLDRWTSDRKKEGFTFQRGK